MKIRALIVFLLLNTARCLELLDEEQLKAEAVFIGDITSRDIQQRLIPDIHFTCAGAITKWTIIASQVGGGSRYPELQIWRRTGTGNEYTKVGRTVFSSTSVSTMDKVYEQTVDPPLNFEPGDILGVYTPPVPQLTFKYQKKGGPTNYYIGGPPSSYSRFSLNGAGVLSTQNDYPLVSVEVNGTECASRFIDRSTLELKASLLTVNNSDLVYTEATQRVIPELEFTESGQIESFTIGALYRGSGATKYPEIQLWRAAGDREWVKVSPTLNSPAVSPTSHLNVYKYQLYPPLQVQAGDVLGIYQPYSSASVLKLYYQQDGPLNYYKPAIGSSTNRLVEDAIGIYSRRNRPLLTMIFRPNSPTTTTTTTSAMLNSVPVTKASIVASSTSNHMGLTTIQVHRFTSHHGQPTSMQPRPTSRPIPGTPHNKTQIILLVCITVTILILVSVVLLVLLKLMKDKMSRGLPDPPVNQRDALDKSLDYNATYTPTNPSEIITDGKKQVVDLAINTAYRPPKLETVEHIYDTID